ncbi:MAG: hypothetical protein ACJ79A_15530 [Gemmatimonadaceae bacterium]
MGFPRTGLLTSTSSLAAASASRDAADPIASPLRRTSALSPSLRDEPIFNRCITVIARAYRAATASYSLLLLRSGRHALDAARARMHDARLDSKVVSVVAVKNLRIVDSTVLLLNFSEVRSIHLCSTGVTM